VPRGKNILAPPSEQTTEFEMKNSERSKNRTLVIFFFFECIKTLIALEMNWIKL